MKIEFRKFLSSDHLTGELVGCLETCFAAPSSDRFAVMLAGGRTPLAAYGALARRGGAASGTLSILYSDERDVSPGSPESNYGNTRLMLEALSIEPSKVIRVKTELGWRASAIAYDRELRGFFAEGGTIKLGLLGLGVDGHTASLFTPDDVAAGVDCYAIPVARPQKPDRVSVTPALLRHVERLIILAAGPDKQEMVAKLIRSPDEVVAGLALHDRHAVELWYADS